MDLTEQIVGNFPKTIDKSKPIFSRLIANEDKNGVLQVQIEYLLAYMKEWVSTPNVYEQHGDMLDKTISFFSYLKPFVDETETSLKNRFRAIFVRNHDTKWGTPFDVKNVFKQYFPNADIYLAENTNKIDSTEPGLANILQDGDISTDTPTEWTLTDCEATGAARFSKSFGIEFKKSGGSLSQTVTVATTREVAEPEPHYVQIPYYLHFFLSGKINVQITDKDGEYWDNSSKTWKATEVNNTFENAEWDNCSLFFIPKDTYEEEEITVSFHYAGIVQSDLKNFAVNDYNGNVLTSEETLTDCTETYGIINLVQESSKASYETDVTYYSEPEDADKNIYGLKFSCKGRLSVTVKNDNNEYWDLDRKIWKSTEYSNEYFSNGMSDKEFDVIINSGTTKLTVEYTITPNYTDYFRLYAKQAYSSFTVIAHFEGYTASGVFGLAGGDDDPNIETQSETPPQPRYGNYGYYDKSFLSGIPTGYAQDIYEDLLDYLRSQGVRAFLDIVIRDYIEE